MLAMKKGDIAIIKLLLAHGADINQQSYVRKNLELLLYDIDQSAQLSSAH